MFLVTITHRPLRHLLSPSTAEDFQLSSSRILTIVTDQFLSTFTVNAGSFSVIESLSVSSPNTTQLLLSQVNIDTHENTVDVSRSPIGGRPIYYHISGSGELFCSSHISMLRKVGIPIEENKDVLPELFVYRYVMPPQTLYRDINQIVLASHVYFRFRDGKYAVSNVDHYQPPQTQNGKQDTQIHNVAARTLSILDDSMHPLKHASDEIACLFSGGLDSSVLFKISQNKFRLQSTYSTGYPFPNGTSDIEKDYAYSASESFGTKHFHSQFTIKEYLYGFLEAISAAEQPVHHIQSVLLYLLFRDGIPISKDIVISGEAADTIFGLRMHNTLFMTDRNIFKILSTTPIARLVQFGSHGSRKARFVAAMLDKLRRRNLPLSDPEHLIWILGAHGDREWTATYFNIKQEDIIRGRYDAIKPFAERSVYDLVSILNLLGGASATTAIWSKLGEARQKKLCYPYVSIPMMDYVYQIPWTVKLNKPKNVLRHMAKQLCIPGFIIDRPKSAFGIEPEHWAVKGGWFEPLIPLAKTFFPRTEIRDLQSIDPGTAAILWNVLNYSIWKRLLINHEPIEHLVAELEDSIARHPSLS